MVREARRHPKRIQDHIENPYINSLIVDDF
jgi:hypothetical protein